MSSHLERHCLVTVGATANFSTLLETVTTTSFMRFLAGKHFTHLHLQCGKEVERFREQAAGLDSNGLNVDVFNFVDDLRKEKMVLCRADGESRRDGVIISHAGTGTLLDALRVNVPIIMVANPTLKDNHQEELADEMQRQGYAIWGKLDNLEWAVEQVELQQAENGVRWRPNSLDPEPTMPNAGFWAISGAVATRYLPATPKSTPTKKTARELAREDEAKIAMD